MKRLTSWCVGIVAAGLLVAAGSGCSGGGDETPKNKVFTPQQESKKERKPKLAIGEEETTKIPQMPAAQRKQ